MPIPALAAAAAPAIIQGVGGLVQSIFGGNKEKKALNALESLQTPKYTANKGILDYYNTAMQRYNVNPYQSQEYQYGQTAANRNLAAGVGALQDRRSAVGGISRLTAGANDAALRNGIAAEQEQNQRFGQLGSATGMKAQDDMTRFQYNEVAPYEKQYNLLSAKAGSGANLANAGLQNIFGGLSSASMLGSDYLMNKPQTSGASGGYNYGSNVPSNYSDYLKMRSYYGNK